MTNVMTLDEDESVIVDTSDDKKAISRMVLQRIISSDASRYMSSDDFRHLQQAFLSREPEADITLTYSVNPKLNDYYGQVASVAFKWHLDESKLLQDLEGNVWTTWSLRTTCKIGVVYGCSSSEFKQRAEVISLVSSMIVDIEEMMSTPIRVMKFTNQQRIDHEEMTRIEETTERLIHSFKHGHYLVRKGLRINGKARHVNEDVVLGIKPGEYHIEINDGSKYRPRLKKYVVNVPKKDGYRPSIRRVS